MGVMKIEMLGSEALRVRAEDVSEIGEETRRLIRDMFDTMYHAEGIGLAGPQVGVSQRIIVVDVREDGSVPFAMVNPRLADRSSETEKAEEGCLSIPGLTALVERPATVVVEGQSESGEPVRIEAEGLLARCLQHEIDHLDGILFIDKLSPLKRNMLLKRYRSQLAADGKSTETTARSRG